MIRSSPRRSPNYPWRWALTLGLAVAETLPAAAAPPSLFPVFGAKKQEKPAEDTRRFSKNREFILPFNLNESEKPLVAQVHLFVRSPAEGWRRHDTQDPEAGKFRFQVPTDGEYWFNIVTADKQGKLNPPDTANMTPALRVVVDTQAPLVQLATGNGTPGQTLRVTCDDRHLDEGTLKVEIEEPGMPWRELKPMAGGQGLYPLPSGKPCRVRAQAADLAGNLGTAELAAAYPLAAVLSSEPLPQPALPQAGIFPPAGSLNQAAGLPPAGSLDQAPPPSAAGKPRLVNSPKAALDYQIEGVGPSGVSKVEIWITGDGGKTWTRRAEDPDMISPAVVDLPGEGVHGLIVHAVNGSGGGDPPPGPNASPDIVLEVDSTRPAARILAIKPSGPEATGAIDISYAVADKNLGHQPVTLLVASRKGGPWTPLAQRVANTGTFRWDVPRHAGYEFHFRVEAIDLAGNLGAAETDQAVRFDTSRPKARVVQVRAEAESTTPVVPVSDPPLLLPPR